LPVYMVPYGLSTLFYGLLSDRIGRRRVIYLSLASFTMLTFLTASARSTNLILANANRLGGEWRCSDGSGIDWVSLSARPAWTSLRVALRRYGRWHGFWFKPRRDADALRWMAGPLYRSCQLFKRHGRSGLMERGDWPNCVDTIRPIYEPEALQATFIVATEDEADLLKFLLGSGYRDQENRCIGVFGS
jgi:hypothetical protein